MSKIEKNFVIPNSLDKDSEHIRALSTKLRDLRGIPDSLDFIAFHNWINQKYNYPNFFANKGDLFFEYLKLFARENVFFGLSIDPLSLHADKNGNPPGSYFTVTSHLAFTGEKFDGLLPSEALPFYNRTSHLGFWVENLRSQMLRIFGEKARVKSVVWMGQKASANLYKYVEENVYKATPEQKNAFILQQVISLNYDGNWCIAPWVEYFLEDNFYEKVTGKNWYLDEKYGTSLVAFLYNLHFSDGWENDIKTLVLGPETKAEDQIKIMSQRQTFVEQFERFIHQVRQAIDNGEIEFMIKLKEDKSKNRGAIVVEIDPNKMYEDTNGIGIHFFSNNPRTTVTHWRVLGKAIRRLYTNQELAFYLSKIGYSAYDIKEMPVANWAGDINPGSIYKLGSQFWSLFHGSEEERKLLWIEAIKNGLSIPIVDDLANPAISKIISFLNREVRIDKFFKLNNFK